MKPRARFVVAASVVFALAVAQAAHASLEDRGEELFREGVRLASDGNYHYLGCAKTFALMGEARADIVLADRVRLGLWGEILYYRSWWANQDQRFYAGPDAGLEFDGIDGEIERRTYMLGARVAIAF